jgi:hypothetical protein
VVAGRGWIGRKSNYRRRSWTGFENRTHTDSRRSPDSETHSAFRIAFRTDG